MQTDRWIDLLASQAEPVAARRVAPLMLRALAWGLAGAVAIMLAGYGLRHDFAQVVHLPMFWLKVGVPLVIALAGLLLVSRLGRPGVRAGQAWWGVALPVLLLWVMGAWQWMAADPADRPPLLWGQTWRTCVMSVPALRLPPLRGGRGIMPLMMLLPLAFGAGAAAGV